MNPLPVMRAMCATCPFRDGGLPVRDLLERRALTEGTPICHSTGDSEVTKKKIFKTAHACRGARDLQLQLFAAIGFIEAATDEAWAKKVAEITKTYESKSRSKIRRSSAKFKHYKRKALV